MMAGAIFSTECSASVKYSMQSSLKWYWSIKWHWIIALISVTIRNEISLESIDIREFNFHTHFLRILYKKYFEAVNTQWFINLFAMFIIIRYIIKKESTENDGGWSKWWFITKHTNWIGNFIRVVHTHYYEISNCLPDKLQ